ncbi:MAG: radical SAM protein, partial [Planctomycetota bacterium]|nr:radical SAM protein [Planctomycetota bacterium]
MSQPERDPRPVDEVIESEGVARAIGLKYVASLLYTYRCNLACKHCLFNCGPHQPEVYASHEDGLEFLRQLHATDRAIHIAGGEALLHYDEVLKLCRAANEEGVAPHFIESNAKWCEDDSITRHRLTELKEAGVKGMLFSADPYHQIFFSPSNRARAFQIAEEVFGRENIAASDLSLVELHKLKQIGRQQVLLSDYVRKHQPRMVGRAGNHLARFLPDRSLADLTDDSLWHGAHSGENCAREFDPETMWEIHIDPYGNIQTCCGIIVGNAHETPLPELMAKGFH